MTNKTFKCPKCGGTTHNTDSQYMIDGGPVRFCNGLQGVCGDWINCDFAWSHLNDHLYLKEEQEIVRCPIVPSEHGNYLIAKLPNTDKCLHLMLCHHGFQGFEFSDGSVSLGSPWAWKDSATGDVLHYTAVASRLLEKNTPVLAKFVRVKGGSR